MIPKYNVLNKKQANLIIDKINERWGCKVDYAGLDCSFLQSKDDKIHIIDNKIKEVDLSRLRINSMGLYIAELFKNEIRLSSEGAEFLGKQATRNIVELDVDEFRMWMSGEEIELKNNPENTSDGFVIVKYKDDIIGCGKLKDKLLLNFLSKIRRVKDIII